MSRKTEVLRVTTDEAELIKSIRLVGMKKFAEELDVAVKLVSTSLSSLKSVKCSLIKSNDVTLEELLFNGTLKESDYEYLLESLNENRHIAITGAHSSGKTTMLKALLSCNELMDTKLCIFEGQKEVETYSNIVDKSCVFIDPRNTYTKDLLEVSFRGDIKRLVFSEITTHEDALILALMLRHKPTIFTVDSNSFIRDMLLSFENNVSDSVLSTIKKETLVIVHCEYNEDNYNVSVVKQGVELATSTI